MQELGLQNSNRKQSKLLFNLDVELRPFIVNAPFSTMKNWNKPNSLFDSKNWICEVASWILNECDKSVFCLYLTVRVTSHLVTKNCLQMSALEKTTRKQRYSGQKRHRWSSNCINGSRLNKSVRSQRMALKQYVSILITLGFFLKKI